jgi:hypothetical protein
MALNREQLFVALFTRLQTQLGSTVKSYSRRWVSWDDEPPAMQPALLLLKGNETSKRGEAADIRGAPKIWTISAEIWIYVKDDGTAEAVPSIQINQMIQAIEAGMEIQAGEQTSPFAQYIARRDAPPAATTLGGLCISCEIVGEVEIDEGTQSHTGVIRIPVAIQAAA